MSKFQMYTDNDVQRWETNFKRHCKSVVEQIRSIEPRNPGEIADLVSILSGSLSALGMTYIAKGDYTKGLGYIQSHCNLECLYYEAYEQGFVNDPTAIGATQFQTIFEALACKDHHLARRFARLYALGLEPHPKRRDAKDAVYIGSVLKNLVENNESATLAILETTRPKEDSWFYGYIECLYQIVTRKEEDFIEALRHATERWGRYVRRNEKGLPDSVCFLQGVGMIRLAENIFGHSISVSIDYIPKQLLGDIVPEKIELGLPWEV